MLDALDLSAITDPAAREIIAVLVQVIEAQAAEIAELKETVQQLRDENAWLKGEQGKPTIRPRPAAHSSEQERPADRPPSAPRRAVVVDREEVRRVDRSTLPSDAAYKGLEPFVVQEVVLRTDTVRYLREKWYAPSTGRTYLADLPAGVSDHFGPQVKASSADAGTGEWGQRAADPDPAGRGGAARLGLYALAVADGRPGGAARGGGGGVHGRTGQQPVAAD